MSDLNYFMYQLSQMNGGLLRTILMFHLIFSVVQIVALWRIFSKMGYPGWYSIIPYFKNYILYRELYGDGWLFFLASIPVVRLYFIFKFHTDLAHNFGKSTAFGVGLSVVVLSSIFYPILGFGSATYERVTYSFWGGREYAPPAERPRPAAKALERLTAARTTARSEGAHV